MRRFLLFVSLLIGFVGWTEASDFHHVADSLHETRMADDSWSWENGQWTVSIETARAAVTGICMIKTDETGSRGAIVNEFGIHALDFTVSPDRRQVKLRHVVGFLNKWYIKKVLRNDLRFLLCAVRQKKDRHRELRVENGNVVMQNHQYHITYTFTPIKDDTTR